MNIIYKTTNIVNSKYYIGMSQSNNPSYLGSGLQLKHAIKKYGGENFTKEILQICESKEELASAEKQWIEKYDAVNDPQSYNMHEGGFGGHTGAYHKVGRSGELNPMYGYSPTPEEREHQSVKIKEWMERETQEAKAERYKKCSESQKGRPKNPKSVEKMKSTKQEFFQNHKITSKHYTLTSPNNEIFTFHGKEDLSKWCKEQNLSLWTIERILLKGNQPKSGKLLGWTATSEFNVRITNLKQE